MRVLLITGEFPPMQGGVGDCTNEIAQALAARGAQVSVLTSTYAATTDAAFHPSAFLLHPSVKSWDWSSLRVISQTLRDLQPDLVHLQFQTGAFGMHPAIYFLPTFLSLMGGGRKASRHENKIMNRNRGARDDLRRGVRSAITFHDLRVPYLFPKAGRLRGWITRFLARTCDAVIATNAEDYSKLETWDLKQLALIPIGSNIPTTQPPSYQRSAWRARLGVGAAETLLCYFGFLNESKGGETLIRALARLPDAKLLMIGGQVGASDPTNAAFLARVKALIAELGLTQRVLWTDFVPPETVTANFLAADLCVMPYREGASFRHGTLLAALAHGCAIVTTLPPTPLMKGGEGGLRDGENCLLVSPDHPRALADAIQRAMAYPDLRAKIGAGARALAQHFTWDKIASKHLDLYQKILK
jgi:glycosyltransferase involved in cell wall biosynthesis